MSAYRTAAVVPQKPVVALLVRGKAQLQVTIFLGIFALFPLVMMSFVTVRCERTSPGGDGSCQVEERSLLRWRTQQIALRDLLAIRADENTDHDGDSTSRLVLDTTHGEVGLGVGSDNLDMGGRRELAQRFSVFRNGNEPRFAMTSGYGGIVFTLFWSSFCVLFIFVSRGRTVRVVIDPQREAILVRRWFKTITLPLTRDVRVVSEKDSDGDDVWRIESLEARIPLPQHVRPSDLRAFEEAVEEATRDPRDLDAPPAVVPPEP